MRLKDQKPVEEMEAALMKELEELESRSTEFLHSLSPALHHIRSHNSVLDYTVQTTHLIAILGCILTSLKGRTASTITFLNDNALSPTTPPSEREGWKRTLAIYDEAHLVYEVALQRLLEIQEATLFGVYSTIPRSVLKEAQDFFKADADHQREYILSIFKSEKKQ